MFNRRGLRRGGLLGRRRLRGRRHPLRAAALRLLDRAHRLLGAGQAAEAAPLFAELAQGAENHGMPARAAQLHLQTARALGQAGARADLLAPALRAVSLLRASGDLELLGVVGPRYVQELRGQGFTTEADQVQQAVNAALGGAPAPAAPAAASPVRLAAMCPQCGGPVRSDEVEWIDDNSAECPYCGSTLLGQ